jgi:hypothetical protein
MLPKFAKDDVFGLMFFVDDKFRNILEKELHNLFRFAKHELVKQYYFDYEHCKKLNMEFDVIGEILEEIKNEMILYYSKNAIQLTQQNFEHYLKKVVKHSEELSKEVRDEN